MEHYIRCGVDEHDETLRCRIGTGKETPKNAKTSNTRDGRELLFTELRDLGGRGVVVEPR